MSFQEKQEQGYTVSIHNIFTYSKVKGVKMLKFLKIIFVHSDEVKNSFGSSDDKSFINEW